MILNSSEVGGIGRSTAEYMRWRELMNATVTRTTAAPADSASSMAANWEAPANERR